MQESIFFTWDRGGRAITKLETNNRPITGQDWEQGVEFSTWDGGADGSHDRAPFILKQFPWATHEADRGPAPGRYWTVDIDDKNSSLLELIMKTLMTSLCIKC